jgi:hypothetical protein
MLTTKEIAYTIPSLARLQSLLEHLPITPMTMTSPTTCKTSTSQPGHCPSEFSPFPILVRTTPSTSIIHVSHLYKLIKYGDTLRSLSPRQVLCRLSPLAYRSVANARNTTDTQTVCRTCGHHKRTTASSRQRRCTHHHTRPSCHAGKLWSSSPYQPSSGHANLRVSHYHGSRLRSAEASKPAAAA